jgi:hypothetical protein
VISAIGLIGGPFSLSALVLFVTGGSSARYYSTIKLFCDLMTGLFCILKCGFLKSRGQRLLGGPGLMLVQDVGSSTAGVAGEAGRVAKPAIVVPLGPAVCSRAMRRR